MKRIVAEPAAMSLSQIARSNRKALTAEYIADLLTMNVKSVYQMAKQRRISCIRIGTLVRFDPNQTAVWLEAQNL